MAIAGIAARGTGVSSTSSATFTMNPSAAIAAGRVAILTVSTDNDASATTTAASNRHTSVTDATGANTWVKLGEYTNGQGAAAAGVTVSVWLCNVEQQLNTTGTTITATLGTAVVDKVMSLYEFSVDSGSTLEPVAGAIAYQAVNAANGFGSSALSGLPSKQYLFYRGMGKEANTTTALTVTSGFVAITNNRSRNNTSAMTVYGEWDIDTLTGVTSNPTLAVTGDTASVFVALEEVAPSTTVVGNDQDGAYAIVQAVGADHAGAYGVSGVVGNDLAGAYAMLATVGADLSGTYAVATAVGADLSGAYVVVAAVGSDLAGGYGVAGVVGADLQGGYGVAGAVGNDLTGSYAVLAAVGADLTGAYAAVAAVGADLVGSYAMVSPVGNNLAGGYGIAGSVGSDLSGQYLMLQAVGADQPDTYSVLEGVGADLADAYGVLAWVSADLEGEYQVISVQLPTVRAPSGNGYARPVAAMNRTPLLQDGRRPARQPATNRWTRP